MSDQDDRNPRFFGKAQQHGRHFLDLGNGARGTIHPLGVHGLDGVHHHQVGSRGFGFLKDALHERLAENQAVGGISSQPVGPHHYLSGALFTRHIEGFEGRTRQRNLQRQGGFADARLSADQHQGTLYQSPAEDAVHLVIAKGNTVLGRRIDIGKANGFAGCAGDTLAPDGRLFARDNGLFHHGVPLPARRAAPHPFGAFVAARGAEPAGLRFCARCHDYCFAKCFSQAQAAARVSSIVRSARQPRTVFAREGSAQMAVTSPSRRGAKR